MAVTKTQMKVGGSLSAVVLAIVGSVVLVEGGYVNNPKDPGGETNHGVTKAVAVENGYKGAMRDLTVADATAIYTGKYVNEPGFLPIIELSPAVGQKIVDAGVNTGPARPARWFQSSLNALNRGGQDYASTNVDGKVGGDTIRAYRDLQRVRGKVPACEMVLKLVDAQQAVYYMSLTNLSTFTPGWISHRIGNVPITRCADEQ